MGVKLVTVKPMPRPTLYLAATGHGFGHAVRIAAVAATIQSLCPEILLIIATNAPRWLLEAYLDGDFIHRQRSFDVGVIQSDSLNMDRGATFHKWQEILAQEKFLITSEADFLKVNQVGLVLADIPPLVPEIAKAAGVPCWMMSNFGWDFIYRDWGGEFESIADRISQSYSLCDRLFRLPLHEPLKAFSHIEDAGLTGGNPKYNPEALQIQFGFTKPKQKTVLLTFGGLGLQQIPYQSLAKFPDWQFISFDRQAPDLDNLTKVIDPKYRPVDFMPLCGRLISKPGYSTFAEALRLDCPITSLTRDDFAEGPVLLAGIRSHGYHQIISPAEFFQGNWEFLNQDPLPPQSTQQLDKNGNETIAKSVIDYLINGSTA